MKRGYLLIVAAMLLLIVPAAFGAVIGNPRPVFLNTGGLDPLFNGSGTGVLDGKANPTQLGYNYFSPTGAGVSSINYSEFGLIFEFAGLAIQNELYLYNFNTNSELLKLFPGPDSPETHVNVQFSRQLNGTYNLTSYYAGPGGAVIDTETFDTPSFGFLLKSGNNNFYGDDSLNSGSAAQMLTFAGTGSYANAYWFAFEDIQLGSSDKDYNDLVFYAQSINPVPEPGTMMLLGSGLIGLAGWGRKKFRK